MDSHKLKFNLGQIIEHDRFRYRGVIFDADAQFSGSEAWYQNVAKSRPPKNAPWYHVLVDGSDITTYVAERHIKHSENISEIHHPLISIYFSGYSAGQYHLSKKQ